MTDQNEPALSAEEWASLARREFPKAGTVSFSMEIIDVSGADFSGPLAPAMIALANAALPDSDPRKITRERLLNVKKGMDVWFGAIAATGDPEDRRPWEDAIKFLAALESYLPPEP